MESKSDGKRVRVQFGPFRCDLEITDPEDQDGEGKSDFDAFGCVIGCLPGSVQGHLKNARVEFLKAARAMLDERIRRAEKSAGGEGDEPRVQKVPVE